MTDGEGAKPETVSSQDEPRTSNRRVLNWIAALYAELFNHDGYGEMRIEMRILRRGQKEVIVHCGKQHRFVLDFPDSVLGLGGTFTWTERHTDGR